MSKCIQCEKKSKQIICATCYTNMPSEEDLILSFNNTLKMLVHYEFRHCQIAGKVTSTEGSILGKIAGALDAYNALKSGAANEKLEAEIAKEYQD